MDKIKYLCKYHNLQIQIEKKKEYISFCEERSNSIPGPCYDKIGTNPSPNLDAPFVKWIYRRIDAEAELKELEEKALKAKMEIEDSIAKLDDPDLERVLIYRYIDWKSWKEISEKMFYSSSTVRRKHEEALDKLVIEK